MTELRSILATFVADVKSQHEAMDKKISFHTHESYARDLQEIKSDLQKTKKDLQEARDEIERLKNKKHTHSNLTTQISDLQQGLVLAQGELSYINGQLAKINSSLTHTYATNESTNNQNHQPVDAQNDHETESNTATAQIQAATNVQNDNETEEVAGNLNELIVSNKKHPSNDTSRIKLSGTTEVVNYNSTILEHISKTEFYYFTNTKKENLMKYYDSWLNEEGKVDFCELHVLLLISLLYLKLNKNWSASPSITVINTHLAEADRVIPNNYEPNNAIIRDYLNQDKRKMFTNKKFESSLNCFIDTVEGKNKFCDDLRKIYT